MWNELFNRNIKNLYTRFVEYDDTGRTGQLIGMHYHDEMEFLLITEGFINCHTDANMVTAKAGQIIFVDSRIPHWTETGDGGCRYTVLQFVPEFFESGNNQRSVMRYLYNFTRMSHASVHLIDNEDCTAILRNTWMAHSDHRPGAEKFVLSCIYYLLGYLEQSGYLSETLLTDKKTVKKLLPALEYIEEHYGQQDLSLDAISKLLELNPVYFSRLFKRSTGHGFTEYLNYVRVTKSEELLRTTDLTILEISLEVGFSSVSYYNRIFKRIKNCTPSIYRSAQFSSP